MKNFFTLLHLYQLMLNVADILVQVHEHSRLWSRTTLSKSIQLQNQHRFSRMVRHRSKQSAMKLQKRSRNQKLALQKKRKKRTFFLSLFYRYEIGCCCQQHATCLVCHQSLTSSCTPHFSAHRDLNNFHTHIATRPSLDKISNLHRNNLWAKQKKPYNNKPEFILDELILETASSRNLLPHNSKLFN
jgi:hypothetical protein